MKRRSSRKDQAPGDPLVPAQVQYVNSFHPQAVAITQAAARTLLKRRMYHFQRGPKPAPDENASGLIGTYLDMMWGIEDWRKRPRRWWKQHAGMCRLALDMAMTEPRWTGVGAEGERGCSRCNRVKPISEFPPGGFHCLSCTGGEDAAV